MSSDYALPPEEQLRPQPHPYLHDPILYISGLPPYVKDEDLAVAFQQCAPFRPNIVRDGSNRSLSGTIEFRFLEKAEKALATLQSRPIPSLHPPVLLILSPYPSTTPPTPLPPPQASPRLIKHLPPSYTDSQLYDLFRPFGALASVRTQASSFGRDTGVVEFWREEDAKEAEEAMHCADIEGSNIAVQVWQARKAGLSSLGSGGLSSMAGGGGAGGGGVGVIGGSGTGTGGGISATSEFSPTAPSFVPSGSVFSSPTLTSGAIPMSPYSPGLGGMALGGMNVGGIGVGGVGGGQTTYSPPPRGSPYLGRPSQSVFVHGPGQQVQLAPLSGPGSSSHSGLIDPCNLFIKNLDTSIDSNGLFTQFRQFGQIVSARVMRNESGESRGFGFVSYQTPDQASAAMHGMNGLILGTKQLVVRLHEPKQLRQEKLAQRFSSHHGSGHGHYNNGHPRSSSGATSPTASEAGESYSGYGGWGSPSRAGGGSSLMGSPIMGLVGGSGGRGYHGSGGSAGGAGEGYGHGHGEGRDRARRSSGSYYHAALQGTLNLPMRYDDLSALSPVVRKEVLSGELSRRIKAMETTNEGGINVPVVSAEDLEAVVDSIVSLSLSEVVAGIQDPNKLGEQVGQAKKALKISTPTTDPTAATSATTTATATAAITATASSATVKEPSPSSSSHHLGLQKSAPVSTSPSPSNSQDSRVLDANALNATASAPDHPSTPVSLPATLSTPPRTESPIGVGSGGGGTERGGIGSGGLLMSLPKRERAMCLFNVEVLRANFADAKVVLDVGDDDEERGDHEDEQEREVPDIGSDGANSSLRVEMGMIRQRRSRGRLR